MTAGRKSKALLLGAYGQTNLGDDLLLYNYLRLLRSQGVEEVIVNASRPDLIPKSIKREFPDITTFATYGISPLKLLKLIRSVDMIVYGGGTVYKELYGSTGRKPYSLIFRIMIFNWLAKLMGRPVYHLHIGIGTLKTRFGRFITKYSLKPARYTVFRDQKSYDVAIKQLGLQSVAIEESTDALFIEPKWRKLWNDQPLPVDRSKYKNIVGINVLHDIPDWVDMAAYISTIRKFIEQRLSAGDCVVMLPFQNDFNPHHDLAFMQKHFGDIKGCVILEAVPIDLIVSYLKQLDMFVGMRFHSLLLATANSVPYLAVSYDTKCTRFLEEGGYEHAIGLEDLTLKKLESAYQSALKDKPAIRRTLAGIAEAQYARGGAWLDRFELK